MVHKIEEEEIDVIKVNLGNLIVMDVWYLSPRVYWIVLCYTWETRPEVSNVVTICINLICHQSACVLCHPRSTFYYVSIYFSIDFDIAYDTLNVTLHISTPI